MPLGREALPEFYLWQLCEVEQLGATYHLQRENWCGRMDLNRSRMPRMVSVLRKPVSRSRVDLVPREVVAHRHTILLVVNCGWQLRVLYFAPQ